MKAAQYKTYGGPEVIEINSNATKPTLSKGQILVEAYAASIDPIDWKVRVGYLKDYAPVSFPVTIGGSFSGVVREVGDNVIEFKPGDEVYGQALVLNGGSGSFAEFLVSNVSNTSYKPKNVSFLEAAALPLVGASALQALDEHIKLTSGQKILIHGGAGGIGSIAIQIAKSKGAYVATTVKTKDLEFAKSLGVDEVIDYKKESFENVLQDFDAVFDTSGANVDKSFKVLKKGGILVSMTGEPDPKLAKEYGVVAIGQNTNTSRENLTKVKQLVEDLVVKPQVFKVFPLEKAKQAFEYFETDHPRGKIGIEIKK